MAEAVWTDPYTGGLTSSSTAPLGGPTPAIPAGTAYIGDIFGQMYAVSVPAGGSADTAYAYAGYTTQNPDGSYSYNRNPAMVAYTPDRGQTFYFAGDEWTILQGIENIGGVQSALESIGALSGDYISGELDPKTAAAFAKVLAAANASGMSWMDVLNRGFDAAKSRASQRGGGGAGAAALTDDDIKALGNKVAQGVLGRNLRDDEVAGFIPAFRGTIGGGTSAATAGENVVRQVNPAEAYAHDVGNAMQMVSKMLGGMS